MCSLVIQCLQRSIIFMKRNDNCDGLCKVLVHCIGFINSREKSLSSISVDAAVRQMSRVAAALWASVVRVSHRASFGYQRTRVAFLYGLTWKMWGHHLSSSLAQLTEKIRTPSRENCRTVCRLTCEGLLYCPRECWITRNPLKFCPEINWWLGCSYCKWIHIKIWK